MEYLQSELNDFKCTQIAINQSQNKINKLVDKELESIEKDLKEFNKLLSLSFIISGLLAISMLVIVCCLIWG